MFPDDQSSAVRGVIGRVMNYLIEHPSAKDTLKGIEGWWLGTGGAAPRTQVLRQAVDALVGAGWMSVSNPGETHAIYEVSELGLAAGMNYLDRLQQGS